MSTSVPSRQGRGRLGTRFLRDASIKKKLFIISILSTCSALLFACITLVFFEYQMYHYVQRTKMLNMADVVAVNSTAALTFDDPVMAAEILAALGSDEQVMKAAIYDGGGRVFATFTRTEGDQESFPERPMADGPHYLAQTLLVFRPVVFREGRLGTIFVQSDLMEIKLLLRRFVITVMVIFVGAIFIAFVVSGKVQRVVSSPVAHLTEVADAVSLDRDYSIRASPHGADELGALIYRFNEMLAHIEQRDEALKRARDELEERVRVRTRNLRDEVAERRKTEEALAAKAEELARSNQELEQFAYVASHDLQEPLRMISSYVQLLARRYKGKLDSDADDFINFAVDGSKRMQSLINALLTFSRIGTKQQEMAEVDLGKIMEGVLAGLQVIIEETGAEVIHGEFPFLRCDEAQLSQLMQNLVNNAIKFQRQDVPPMVRVDVTEEDDDWHFSVADNGIGIDPEYFERIFGIFQRLHGLGKYPGTGIGLAVCKRIVHRHEGKIWVESIPGEGSTFHFTIARNNERGQDECAN